MSARPHPLPAGWLTAYHDGELEPTRRDQAKGRFTFPKVSGMPRSRSLANERVAMALTAISKIEPNPGPLAALARYSVERGT